MKKYIVKYIKESIQLESTRPLTQGHLLEGHKTTKNVQGHQLGKEPIFWKVTLTHRADRRQHYVSLNNISLSELPEFCHIRARLGIFETF